MAGDFVKHKKDSDMMSVWSYFLVAKDGNSAKCKRCPSILKTLGGSTKGLHTHLSTKHNIKVISASTSQDTENLNTAPPPAKRKLDDYFTKTKSDDDNLDDVLARMIALDGFPFSVFITSDNLRKLLLAKYTDLPKSAVTIQKRVMNYSEKIKKASNFRIETFEKCRWDGLFALNNNCVSHMVSIWLSVMYFTKKHNYLQDSPTSDDMDDNNDDDHLEDLDCSESDPEIQVQNESGMTNSIRREMSLFENGGVRGYYLETAYKYLMSIPPTSVEPERAFSAAAYVENYAVLPTQRDNWPELLQAEALRGIEMENAADLFRPWEEMPEEMRLKSGEGGSTLTLTGSSKVRVPVESSEDALMAEPYVLSGTFAHKYIKIPNYVVPQTMAYSYLQMYWQQHIVKLIVQNMRMWFNKQFDDLMNLKKREVGLVEERNSRLRFIISELNELSDLRGSFHHLTIIIKDPEWRQEEQPHRLIKVDPEECSIEPYISPSQVLPPPPELRPKDDFRERALFNMMDGVLEKLWHEEIKKPVPKPQCMVFIFTNLTCSPKIEKDPEHWNEDDLRAVFDYEAKVNFRKEERDKYRKMLHAEYAKLVAVLNEGVVNFNMKVKNLRLTRLKVESVIIQENLTVMRLRRVNLDRLELAENLEQIRSQLVKHESNLEHLQKEMKQIHEQTIECQAAYDTLLAKDKQMERSFRNYFADFSQIVADQAYKFYRKRPKWHQRASMIPGVLYELANAVLTGVRPPFLHPDVHDYFKGVDQLDQLSNMPAVMDENNWAIMCRLRRTKIELEIRLRAIVQELAYAESTSAIWNKAVQARKGALANLHHMMTEHRKIAESTSRNKTIQLVLPAGQVEIPTTGHIEDFENTTLVPREDIEIINNAILKIGDLKLKWMRKQIDFRRVILSKEWEHAQMKMKLRHMKEELYSYKRLKLPKELQFYLKRKMEGYTDEQEHMRMEREALTTRKTIERQISEHMRQCEEVQVKCSVVEKQAIELEKQIAALNAKLSEKRLIEDPLEPLRVRKKLKKRMETLVARSRLIREVQSNHTTIVMLQTELELLRLRTYPTLANYHSFG
ncbi:Cilia- and flagella-associated protein 43 [Eumeta japonica]|uniref:Cilia-and flagella-associated protein 43 n=2 Tax=Eumeta variegata TaxID=151549 RepID=A0A4C1Y4W7_EUMVA|nr:Cilia- and flagella-associated protein 43 [Eumeta japonica]